MSSEATKSEARRSRVVKFPPRPKTTEPPTPKRRAAERWGDSVIARGFTVLPTMLFWAQARLGLKPDEFNVVLQIAAHWWDANEDARPSKDTLADRMGKDPRTIQRHIAALEAKGLVVRRARYRPSRGGQAPNSYSLDGLVKKLQELEPEFRRMVEINRQRRQRVERPKEAVGGA